MEFLGLPTQVSKAPDSSSPLKICVYAPAHICSVHPQADTHGYTETSVWHAHTQAQTYIHALRHTQTYRRTCRAHDGVLFAHTRRLKSLANLSVVKATAHSALCCCSNVNSYNPSFGNSRGGVRSSHNSSCQSHPDSHTLRDSASPPHSHVGCHLAFPIEYNQRDRSSF